MLFTSTPGVESTAVGLDQLMLLWQPLVQELKAAADGRSVETAGSKNLGVGDQGRPHGSGLNKLAMPVDPPPIPHGLEPQLGFSLRLRGDGIVAKIMMWSGFTLEILDRMGTLSESTDRPDVSLVPCIVLLEMGPELRLCVFQESTDIDI